MDNLIQKKKHTALQIIKMKYPDYYVSKGSKWDMVNISPIFLVASSLEGLRFVKENQGRVIEIEKHAWEDIPHELVVKQSPKERKYYYRDKFYLSVQNNTEDGRAIVELLERKRQIYMPVAPWYKNINSYQSGLPIVIFSILYIFIMLSALVSCIRDDDLDSIISKDSSEVSQTVESTTKIIKKSKLQSTTLGDIEVKKIKNDVETQELIKYAFISTKKNEITSYNLIRFFDKDVSKLAGTEYLIIDLQDGTALYKLAGSSMLTYGAYESGNDKLTSYWEDITVNTTNETVFGEIYDGIDLSRALFPSIKESESVEEVVEEPEVIEEPEVVEEAPQYEFFANCTELRSAHPRGVDSSHPAYQSKMDRDKDGVACER